MRLCLLPPMEAARAWLCPLALPLAMLAPENNCEASGGIGVWYTVGDGSEGSMTEGVKGGEVRPNGGS